MGVVAGFLPGMGTIAWPHLKISGMVLENGYLQIS
jgi:hypothetical protein